MTAIDWYCSGNPEAHVGREPVFRSSKAELVALRGEAAYAELEVRCQAHLNSIRTSRSVEARKLLPLMVHPATVAATPIGELTPIDEALEGAGEDIGRFNDRQSEKLLEKLHQAKTPDIAPFKQSVKEIDTLYNRPTQIAVDAENVYILPAKQQEE